MVNNLLNNHKINYLRLLKASRFFDVFSCIQTNKRKKNLLSNNNPILILKTYLISLFSFLGYLENGIFF